MTIYPARVSPLALAVTAVVATVVALHGARAHAAGEAKPCRTPCLAVPKPAEAPQAKEAEPKPAVVRPAPKPRPQITATAAPAPEAHREPAERRSVPSKRCSEINMRAAVGEPLSDQDMTILRSQC
ncbi:hypothetical protein [Variovorax sp. EBFNA2]|uniref:hypothetical protein n=1 Tax=Variovorax sp. EBFNA2 TaxID=3342097 RepID=UPI0029BFD6F1|nr:hypothetical protein [Variovorax boronicumulans]WPG36153.1 hypothetical protein RZE79_22010 [Variovorax boronicumulans]